MKKISIVSLASFIFLIISSIVAIVSKPLFIDAKWPLISGWIVLATSGILALIVRRSTPVNILCFFLSSTAMGLLIRAWYNLRGLENSIVTMVFISFSLVAYLWLFFAISRIPFIRHNKTAFIIFSILFVLISVGVYIFLVTTTQTTYVSTLGYYAIIQLGFIFAMSLEASDRDELIRNLTLSTYSVFVVAIIVAVFVIIAMLGGDGLDCDCDCGGDCCDCCEGCDTGANFTPSKKKKKNDGMY